MLSLHQNSKIMLIGRDNERKILQDALNDEYSQFIAVYGRRRRERPDITTGVAVPSSASASVILTR